MTKKQKSMRCQVTGTDGVRRNFKFSDVTRKDTLEGYKRKLKSLVLAKKLGDIPPQDMNWISDQDDSMKARLVTLGVIEVANSKPKRKPLPTIAEWIEEVLKLKQDPTSKRKFRNVRDKLVTHFGTTKRINELTKADAKRFQAFLIDKENGCGLNQHSTARRYIGYCREIWYLAIDDNKLRENPFVQKDLKASVKTDKDKHHYIDGKVSRRLYAVINNDDYKLRFVLMRYAGLRSPSELNALRWKDVDFEKSELTIRSPKTEHNDDRGIRRCPIFPEVLPELNKAWDRLPFGSKSEFVLPRISNHTLRRHVLRWIGAIGEEVWPQLLVNFRRSARTDKANQFPPHIVNAWFGHSEEVSQVYLMDTEDARSRAREQPSTLTHEVTDTQPQTQKGD